MLFPQLQTGPNPGSPFALTQVGKESFQANKIPISLAGKRSFGQTTPFSRIKGKR